MVMKSICTAVDVEGASGDIWRFGDNSESGSAAAWDGDGGVDE